VQLVGNKMLHISISRKMNNGKYLITSSREVFFPYITSEIRIVTMFVIICLQITSILIYVNVYNRIYLNTNFHNLRSSVSLTIGISTMTNNNFCKTVTLLLSIPQKKFPQQKSNDWPRYNAIYHIRLESKYYLSRSSLTRFSNLHVINTAFKNFKMKWPLVV